MTAPEITAPRDRWLRAIGYGLLAEIATIFTIVAVVLLYRYVFARSASEEAFNAFAGQAGALLGVIGGTLYVYLFAHLLMRRLVSRFVAHGVVVGIAAIALSVSGSLIGHQGLQQLYWLASLLKLIAGASAGWVASRRAHLTT